MPVLGLSGCWRAETSIKDESLEVFAEIAPALGDHLLVRLSVPKLGILAAPAEATAKGGKVDIATPGGRYQGTLAADGLRIAGSRDSAKGSIPLEFARVPAFPGHFQEPLRPYPYREEEVAFTNTGAKITFHGTLTVPRTPGPHPAMVLVSGAGCQDRDETVAGHKVFLVIADRLTRRGVAVLRYDDRGWPGTAGDCMKATSEDNASDALAAAAYLASRADIDPARIGISGHSEGGMVAFMAAARQPAIRCVVSLAGVAQKVEDLAYSMLTGFVDANHGPGVLKLAGKALAWPVLSVMKSDATDAEVAARLRMFLPEQMVSIASCPWTRFIIRYDPAVAIEKVKCPILGLYCAEDVQVPARENTEALRAASSRGGNKDVTLVTYPRLNHMLQANGPHPPGSNEADETLFSELLEKLATWVPEKLGAAPSAPAAESR